MPHKHERLLEKAGIVGVYTDEEGDTVVQHDGTLSMEVLEDLSPDGKYEEVRGGITPHSRTERLRPVEIGISHGALDVTAGTTGVLVTKDGVGPLIDTNYHVAVGERAIDREPIVQPGEHDGGEMGRDKYGELYWYLDMDVKPNRLSRFFQKLLNLRRRNNDRPRYYVNKTKTMVHDVALVEPTDGDVTKSIFGVDEYPSTIERAPIGTKCMKSGRTTGITEMKKVSDDWTGKIMYPWGLVKFRDQNMYRGIDGPSSKGGDSGSTILWDNWRRVDGRLFAGNSKENITIGNPYGHFANKYNVELF